MIETSFGIRIEDKDVQLEKTELPIEVRFSGSEIVDKFAQFEKALFPIDFKLRGRETDIKFVHP